MKDIRVSSDSVFTVGQTNTPTFTAGGLDAFILKLNKTNGNLVWGKAFGGSDYEWPETITIDDSNFLYIGGYSGSSGFSEW